MRIIKYSLAAALMLVLTACASLPLNHNTPPRLIAAVQPLQHEGQTYCTAFSINAVDGLWMTARHCAQASLEQKWETTIDGDWASVIWMAEADDVAIFKSGAHGVAIPLASVAPKVGEFVSIEGYPYGLPTRVLVTGRLAARDLHAPGIGISDILDITVAGGNSGSPVMNSQGAIVGVLWGRFTSSEHALSTPWEVLVRLTYSYWQKVL